ncbi:unnamed protein product [Amoebophrya sp. A25]|nr:unnamed protein product [Amoebophrya sp. A25]|eukprot:GSA25T00000636001.1
MWQRFRRFRGLTDWAAGEAWRSSMSHFFEHQVHVLKLATGVIEGVERLHNIQWTQKDLEVLFGGERFIPPLPLRGMQHRRLDKLENFVWTNQKPTLSSPSQAHNIAGQVGLDDVKITGFENAQVIGTRIRGMRHAYGEFLRKSLEEEGISSSSDQSLPPTSEDEDAGTTPSHQDEGTTREGDGLDEDQPKEPVAQHVPIRHHRGAGPETYHDGIASAQEDYHTLSGSLLRVGCLIRNDGESTTIRTDDPLGVDKRKRFAGRFTFGRALGKEHGYGTEINAEAANLEDGGRADGSSGIPNFFGSLQNTATGAVSNSHKNAETMARALLQQGQEKVAKAVPEPISDVAASQSLLGFLKTLAMQKEVGAKAATGNAPETNLNGEDLLTEQSKEGLSEKIPAWDELFYSADKKTRLQRLELQDLGPPPVTGAESNSAEKSFAEHPSVFLCPQAAEDHEVSSFFRKSATRVPLLEGFVNLLASMRRTSHVQASKARFSMPPPPIRVKRCVKDLLDQSQTALRLLRAEQILGVRDDPTRLQAFLIKHPRKSTIPAGLAVPMSCRVGGMEDALGPLPPLRSSALYRGAEQAAANASVGVGKEEQPFKDDISATTSGQDSSTTASPAPVVNDGEAIPQDGSGADGAEEPQLAVFRTYRDYMRWYTESSKPIGGGGAARALIADAVTALA